MRADFWLLFVLPVTLFSGFACASEVQPSILTYELRSLDSPERHRLDRYKGSPVLMTFFQPECRWCEQQIKRVNQLLDHCPGGFRALAIGVHGDRQRLRRELRHLRPDFPAYEASPKLLADIGDEIVTPFTLVGDREGRFKNWLVGLMSGEELIVHLPLEPSACDKEKHSL